eukprot:3045068-Rhodomonas_salina.1
MVEVDDPSSADFGRRFYTRPALEREEKAMRGLLGAHGLRWERMLLDAPRNPFKWGRARLKKKALALLRKLT